MARGPGKENKYWKLRKRTGAHKKYRSAAALWKACVKYFEWVDENPLYETKAFSYQGDVITEDIPLMRAMTVSGLCVHLGITRKTWMTYGEQDHPFSEIHGEVSEIIWANKFEGGAAGLLNANLIARDLGLRERTDNQHSGPDGGPIQNTWTIQPVKASEQNRD